MATAPDSTGWQDTTQPQAAAAQPEAQPAATGAPSTDGWQDTTPAVPTPSQAQAQTANDPAMKPLVEGSDEWYASKLPEGSEKVLAGAKKYLVDPFDKMAASVAETGRQAGQAVVTGYDETFGKDPLKAKMVDGKMIFSRSSEESIKKADEAHPVAMGVARGAGEFAGGFLGDPRNWPLMGAGEALPILNKVLTAGFTAKMSKDEIEGIKNLRDHWGEMSTSARAEAITNLGLGGIAAVVGAAHTMGDTVKAGHAAVTDAFKRSATPEHMRTKTIGGTEVPVRPTNKLAKMAEERAPEIAEQHLKEQAAPAIAEGVADTIQEGAGMTGDHARTTEDPFGLDSMAQEKEKEYQAPVQRIDQISDNAFSNAQMDRDAVSGDFSKAGKEEWKKQTQKLNQLWEDHRSQLESEGVDVDAARKAWGQKSALNTVEKAMRKTTEMSADPSRPFDLKPGKTLGTTIKNLLQHDDAPFQKIFGSKYAEVKPVLEDFARTLNEQSQIAGTGPTPMDEMLGKFTRRIVTDAIGGGIGGYFGGGIGATIGAGAVDFMTNKLGDMAARWYLSKILTTPKALDVLNNSLKLGGDPTKVGSQLQTIVHNNDPMWTDKLATALSDRYHKLVAAYKSSKFGSETGAINLGPEGVEQKRAGEVTGHSSDLRDFSAEHTGADIDSTKVEKDERGPAIADAYDAMSHAPEDPKVKASYDALNKETAEQWKGLEKRGYTLSTSAEQPYSNAQEMLKDIRDNKHITVWEGGQPPADHPMSEIDPETGLSKNTLFRAVHDILGHGKEAHDFSEAGEENAFKQHSQMYSKTAQGALATETKGQAAWVFNHEGVRNGSSQPGDMFPEQKAALLPEEFHGRNVPSEVVDHIKENKAFAVLTAENPMNTRLTDAENSKLNAELLADLKKKGYKTITVEGVNKDVDGKKEHSFFVPDITSADAAELGRKYKQASILTKDGLHDLQKNMVNPSDNKGLLTGEKAKEQPYYSVVNGKPFSVPLDFDKEISATPVTLSPLSERPGKNILSVKVSGERAGQMSMTPMPILGEGAMEMSTSQLKPAFQGQGFGTEMYKQAVDYAKSKGAKTLYSDDQVSSKADRVWQSLQKQGLATLDAATGRYKIDLNRDALDPRVSQENEYRATLGAKEIGTRYPSAANAAGANDPAQLSGLSALNEADKMSPPRMTQAGKPVLGVKQKLVAALAEYKDNGISHLLDASNPDAAIEKYVNHVKDNLKWLHDITPESIRNVARQWYESAHNVTKDIAAKNGVSHQQVAAVTAALSPKNDWNNNVGQAKRLVEHWANDRNHAWTPQMGNAVSDIQSSDAVTFPMKKMLETLRGKKFDQLTARTPEALIAKQAMWMRVLDEAHGGSDTAIYSPDGTVSGSQTLNWGQIEPIAKALSILQNGSTENINAMMGEGHKIRNFYNNLINPWSERGHTTIDTHAVGAGHLKPFSQEDTEVMHNFGSGNRAGTPSPAKHRGTGLKGSYAVHEEAYRRAAKELGLQPRELQSITWEGIRSLFDNKDARKGSLRKDVTNIWRSHEMGQLTLAQAREELLKAAGGFSKPEWMSDEQWERNSEESGDTSFDMGGQ